MNKCYCEKCGSQNLKPLKHSVIDEGRRIKISFLACKKCGQWLERRSRITVFR